MPSAPAALPKCWNARIRVPDMTRTNATLGILGGGQLARMMILAGAPLGLRFVVLEPAEESCAAHLAPRILGEYADMAALEEFAASCELATFDFENVPAASVRRLMTRLPVFPPEQALATAQDRLNEKTRFNALGIATPGFADVDSREALEAALARIGAPAILKTRRLGYDGKGQFRLKTAADADAAWAALGAQARRVGLILEAFVPFTRELSVVAVRSREGEFRAWPITENWHVDGVLCASLAPASVPETLAAQAVEHARKLAGALDYVGVFALELFETPDALLANEMAPRVHNSGHWTIEGAETSQFENHLRAVIGAPLGSVAPRGHSCMLNFIGELPSREALLHLPGAHWHDYGKTPRPGRKTGHATLRADSPEALATLLERAGQVLGRQAQVAQVLERLRAG